MIAHGNGESFITFVSPWAPQACYVSHLLPTSVVSTSRFQDQLANGIGRQAVSPSADLVFQLCLSFFTCMCADDSSLAWLEFSSF